MLFTAKVVFSNRKTQEGPAPEGTSVPSKFILVVFVCCFLFFAYFFLQCFFTANTVFSNRKTQEGPAPEGASVPSKLFY